MHHFFKTQNSIPLENRKVIVECLTKLLADTIDLSIQFRQAHWNVKGKEFSQLHELFGEGYTALASEADVIAERIAQLGSSVCGTKESVKEYSCLSPYDEKVYDGLEHVHNLSTNCGKVGKNCRAAIQTAIDNNDMASSDLVTKSAEVVDKLTWMLESHLF